MSAEMLCELRASEENRRKTLVVNLYGGPGTGKSTTAALTFGILKSESVNAELVTEFAKDLVWEERHVALGDQIYILGKQAHRLERLRGKVDVIITDSPILLNLVYSDVPSINDAAFAVYQGWTNLDVFIQRDVAAHPYATTGRTQSEADAVLIDGKIRHQLLIEEVPHEVVPMTTPFGVAQRVAELLRARL